MKDQDIAESIICAENQAEHMGFVVGIAMHGTDQY